MSRTSPTEPFPRELQAKFLKLRDTYAAKLPSKVVELEQAVARARSSGSEDELKQARSLAHRLRGTAGSYGFSAVSQAGGELEDVILGLMNGSTTFDQQEASLGELLERIRQGVEHPDPVPGMRERLDAPPAASPGASGGTSGALTNDLASAAPVNSRSPIALLSKDEAFAAQVVEAAGSSLLFASVFSSTDDLIGFARARPLRAALLDLELSGGESAVGAARRLRRVAGHGSVPLAFVSTDGALEARIAASHAGADLFLTKPTSTQELADALRQLTAERGLARPRLLLVDDDPDFARALAELLGQEQMDVHVLLDPARIVEVLDEVRPDLLLLDVVLPTVDGTQLCRIVRTNPRWQLLPVLMLTSLGSQDARLAAFEAGADDYLLKPIIRPELLARVRLRLDHARLVRERSTRDSLTGLLTRGAFVEGVVARLAEIGRQGGTLTLCLLDVDHFKSINDRYGHITGDHVLCALGRLLEGRFRDCDLRARWGGEEFVLAFQGIEAKTTASILARLQREVQTTTFVSDSGESFSLSFSAGLSTYPADGTGLDELIRAADRRLYLAKSAGRNQVRRSDEPEAERSNHLSL